jgi:hypothetical protein
MLADAEWCERAKAWLRAAIRRGDVAVIIWYLKHDVDIEDFPDYLKQCLKVPHGQAIH